MVNESISVFVRYTGAFLGEYPSSFGDTGYTQAGNFTADVKGQTTEYGARSSGNAGLLIFNFWSSGL